MQNTFAGVALHTWTLDTTPLPRALGAAKQAGFDAVELRQLDFKRAYENGQSDAEILDEIRASGMTVAVLGVEYGWMFASGEESRRLFGVFQQQCENAVALGCAMLMSAPGQNTGSITDAIANTRIAGELAAEFDLELAIEFNSQHPLVNNIATLREIVGAAEKRNVGLLLDSYHLHRSGRPGRGFEEVPGEEIFVFQFSDCAAQPVEGERRPTDRLLPGQGVVQWTELLRLLAEKGYRGYLSFEAPNPAHWEREPEAVARDALAATRRVLAQAFGGDG